MNIIKTTLIFKFCNYYVYLHVYFLLFTVILCLMTGCYFIVYSSFYDALSCPCVPYFSISLIFSRVVSVRTLPLGTEYTAHGTQTSEKIEQKGHKDEVRGLVVCQTPRTVNRSIVRQHRSPNNGVIKTCLKAEQTRLLSPTSAESSKVRYDLQSQNSCYIKHISRTISFRRQIFTACGCVQVSLATRSSQFITFSKL
jgi:hypothetical protein